MCVVCTNARVTFGDPDPTLGGARTAPMADGGMMGIRGPLNDPETQKPVVRHYLLVDDLKSTVDAAAAAGAVVALPSMPLGDHGTCAVVVQGGIEFGYWQV